MIYVVTDVFPDKNNIYKGTFVEEQVDLLADRTCSRYIVISLSAHSFRGKKKPDLQIYIERKGKIEIVQSKYISFKSTLFPRINYYLFSFKMKKVLKKAFISFGKPDKIICHFSIYSGLYISTIAKKLKIPFIVIEHHSIFFKNNLGRFYRKSIIRVTKEAKAFFTVSSELKAAVEKYIINNKKIIVLPNIISNLFVYKEKIEKKTVVFFSAGNLVKNKGFSELIKAMAYVVNQKQKNCILYIAGDGILKNYLISEIVKNKLEKNVILLGQLNRDMMNFYYIQCDAFVLFSHYETFGITYREAMFVGRPVISTRNNSLLEFWDDRFGILVEKFKQREYNQSLLYMANYHKEFDGKYISELNREYYSNENYVEILKEGIVL